MAGHEGRIDVLYRGSSKQIFGPSSRFQFVQKKKERDVSRSG